MHEIDRKRAEEQREKRVKNKRGGTERARLIKCKQQAVPGPRASKQQLLWQHVTHDPIQRCAHVRVAVDGREVLNGGKGWETRNGRICIGDPRVSLRSHRDIPFVFIHLNINLWLCITCKVSLKPSMADGHLQETPRPTGQSQATSQQCSGIN